ncbi:lamin tail domain-containing protein [Paucibacter sp. DJ1R-11]|uniref:lamin tail domain-containing protein n=1 Tax=Paucibacter sp. DJ1R-11 TaxID=2893556 RepID=UPI0021E3B147|nr:lamin tail domain-containing protein [Paucibacter sp. DJ1R-11]MCV2362774.1 lamin tail domain-containing protein [Paucibacter sp. DJ1R-11]
MQSARPFSAPSALSALVALLAFASAPAQAQLKITEVSAWSSGNSAYGADWFELTNFGNSALSLVGWTMDDNSNGTAKVALTGITSIGAGESVIFTEKAVTASFLNTWFAALAPAGLQIGLYVGAGVGLSTGGDAVNVFDASGTLKARVEFGASSTAAPLRTFDNAAGLNNSPISQLSVVGVNGAFLSADGQEIGSPGLIAAAVPEPESYALMLAGLGLLAAVARKRTR